MKNNNLIAWAVLAAAGFYLWKTTRKKTTTSAPTRTGSPTPITAPYTSAARRVLDALPSDNAWSSTARGLLDRVDQVGTNAVRAGGIATGPYSGSYGSTTQRTASATPGKAAEAQQRSQGQSQDQESNIPLLDLIKLPYSIITGVGGAVYNALGLDAESRAQRADKNGNEWVPSDATMAAGMDDSWAEDPFAQWRGASGFLSDGSDPYSAWQQEAATAAEVNEFWSGVTTEPTYSEIQPAVDYINVLPYQDTYTGDTWATSFAQGEWDPFQEFLADFGW